MGYRNSPDRLQLGFFRSKLPVPWTTTRLDPNGPERLESVGKGLKLKESDIEANGIRESTFWYSTIDFYSLLWRRLRIYTRKAHIE
jgi:hypothetical protein